MYLRIGTTKLALGATELAIARAPIRNERGILWSWDETWQITVTLIGTGLSDVKTKTRNLETTVNREEVDLALLQPNGSTLTHHVLRNRDTVGGVRLTQPLSFPTGKNAEAVTYRTATAAWTARVPVPLSQLPDGIVSFQESLELSGGGPRFGLLETLTGIPQAQTFRRNTIFRARQTGQAVGMYDYPRVPSPLFPQWQPEAAIVTKGHPKMIGDVKTECPISWSYEFVSPYPLRGSPHIWGITY